MAVRPTPQNFRSCETIDDLYDLAARVIFDVPPDLKEQDKIFKNPLLALAACLAAHRTGTPLRRVVVFDDAPSVIDSARLLTRETCRTEHGRASQFILAQLQDMVDAPRTTEVGVLCLDWGECFGEMTGFDPVKAEATYTIAGGETTARLLNELQQRGWVLAWTSNDSDEAIRVYDAVFEQLGVRVDVQANGQRVHDFRMDVLLRVAEVYGMRSDVWQQVFITTLEYFKRVSSGAFRARFNDVNPSVHWLTLAHNRPILEGETAQVVERMARSCHALLTASAGPAPGPSEIPPEPQPHPTQPPPQPQPPSQPPTNGELEAAVLQRDGEIAALRRQIQELSQIIAARDDALGRLDGGFAQVSRDVEGWRDQAIRAMAERDEARAQAATIGCERDAAHLQVSTVISDLDMEHSRVEMVTAERDAARVMTQQVAAERDAWHAEAQSAMAERDELRAQVQKALAEREEMRAQALAVVAECDNVRAQGQQAIAERDEARAQAAAVTVERDALIAGHGLQAVQQRAVALEQEIVVLKSLLQAEKNQAMTDIAGYHTRMTQLTQDVQTGHTALRNLQCSLAQAEQAVTSREEELKAQQEIWSQQAAIKEQLLRQAGDGAVAEMMAKLDDINQKLAAAQERAMRAEKSARKAETERRKAAEDRDRALQRAGLAEREARAAEERWRVPGMISAVFQGF